MIDSPKPQNIQNLRYISGMLATINNNIPSDMSSSDNTTATTESAENMPTSKHMISVIQACHGFSVDDIEEKTGLSSGSIYAYLDGHEPKPKRKAKLYDLYIDAPLRDTVEYLNLHDGQELSWAIAALKRKMCVTLVDLGQILGVTSGSIPAWISQVTLPVAANRKTIIERLIKHGITREDIESEKAINKTFKYNKRDTMANKQILYMKDRGGNIRDIIHRVKQETGVKFKDMYASIDVTTRVWWHYTRNKPKTPNIARQKQLFALFQKIYEEKELDFPFYCKETE